MNELSLFSRFARKSARATGHPAAFVSAVILIIAWGFSGFIFQFNDTWQLILNTVTSIITLLIVLLVQHTQNRNNISTQLKLDEIIRSIDGTHKALLDYEELDENDLQSIRQRYEDLAEEARTKMRHGDDDTEPDEVEVK